MPIVKGLLDQMGGTIDITSEVGVGSTFVIAIPFEIAPAPEVHPAKKTAAAGDIRGLHLLLFRRAAGGGSFSAERAGHV